MTGQVMARLAERNIALPQASVPVANYMPFAITGNQIHTAGQVPRWDGNFHHVGAVGQEVSLDDAYQAARLCGLNIIAQVKAAIDDLDRVTRCVKLNVFVRSADDFADQPKVANGASDLMVEVFGDKGRHARSAIGVKQLPFGVSVEIDAVFEFK
ncbi:MAG TPA: RidA family protein [Terriglobales bacterium]|nr:RidA family protein [Terriglobales bacterium]